MAIRTGVWGIGNVGRPAVRAVVSHGELELAAVMVSSPEKDGQDAGGLVGLDPLGVQATRDVDQALAAGLDVVAYTASGDMRPAEALADLERLLRAGVDVVSTSFYPLLHPELCPEEVRASIESACGEGDASIFVSGMDPGWVMDVLPILLSGVVADIREIRMQELFNYALYHQPDAVRELAGFGQPMEATPPMLLDFGLQMVWGPMLRLIAEALGESLDAVETVVEKRALERDVEVAGMGHFAKGTQGAFRFEVRGMVEGTARIVAEHVTRIDDACAPEWPYPPEGQGAHRVLLDANPHLELSLHADDHFETGAAAGGNATAAARMVNAIPAVAAAGAGILTPLDLPSPTGQGQTRWRKAT